jgi:hypothetical protein
MQTATEPKSPPTEEPFEPPLEDDEWEEEDDRELDEEEDRPEDDAGEIEMDEAALLDKARLLGEIQDIAETVALCQTLYERAKKAATARKADYEDAVVRLTARIKASKETLPLFDRTPQTEPTADVGLNGAEGVQLADVEAFPTRVAVALEDIGITTIGQLAGWARTNRLEDLKGVGPAKAEAASDAMTFFWQTWHEKYPPTRKESHAGAVEEAGRDDPDRG